MVRFLSGFALAGALFSAAPTLAAPLVYVADPLANTLTAINSGDNTITRTLPNLPGAKAVAITPDGTRVYVAEAGTSGNGEVAILDGTKIANPNEDPLIGQLAVGGNPVAVAYDAGTNLLYVADAANNRAESFYLTTVDTDDPQPVATYSAGDGLAAMALAADGQTLALASTAIPAVILYNLRAIVAGGSGRVVVNLASAPRALAFSARGDELWIATDGGFSGYSFVTGALVNVAESGGTTSIAVAQRSGQVYFGAGSGNFVYAYTPATGNVTLIGSSGPVRGLAVSADGTRLYAAENCQDCGADVLSTATGQALAQIKFGSGPQTAGDFAGPGDIHAPNATTSGAIDEQLSGSVSASDYSSRPLSYTVIESPAAGTLSFNATGDFAYTPPAGHSGIVRFVWQASAAGGEGSPTKPLSRPITETLATLPAITAIKDQKADSDSTLGPLAFTITGTKPFTIALQSSNEDLVSAGAISVSAGCGSASLSCSLTVPVKDVANGNTEITLAAIGPDGLAASTRFKITVGNGDNDDGGGAFAPAALGGLALVLLFGLAARQRRRIHGRV